MFAKISTFLFVATFSLVAIYIILKLLSIFYMVETSRRWVPVEGRLISSAIEKKDDIFRKSAPIEYLRAEYEYTYNEAVYREDAVDLIGNMGDNFSSARRQLQLVMLHAQPLIVYVNPVNPAVAVIDRSLPAEIVLFGIFFLLFPCGLATFAMMVTVLRVFDVSDRYLGPVAGMFHGTPAIWVLLRYHDSYGLFSTGLLLVIASLFFKGAYHLAVQYRK